MRARMTPIPPGDVAVVERPSLRAFRFGWTLFVVLATTLPYVVNRLSVPGGSHYSWIVPPYPEDSLAYMAWSQQAAHGSLLFRLKYTALPHSAFLFQPLFLVCGWLSALFGCDIGLVHLVVKSLGVVLFLAAFYRYTDYLRLSGFQSRLASVLVGVSSGLGAFISFFDPTDRSWWASSADLWVVDANTWWSLLWNPLFPYSLTLMLLAIYWMDRGTQEGRPSDLWRSGLATGAQILIHPYSQPLLFALALVIVVKRRGWRKEAAAYLWRYALATLPCALYVDAVATFHPLVSRHNAQSGMVSPPFSACLLGFGLPLLLAVVGVAAGWRRPGVGPGCAGLWFVLSCAFAYLPFWFQRKLLFGAHVPLCILAGAAPDLILARFPGARARPWIPRLALALFLVLVVATPVYLLVTGFDEAHANPDGAYFVDDGLMEGLRFLKEKSEPQSVVFASPSTSRLIPAFSGNTVVWGHWAQSVDRQERERWFADLFKPGSDWNDATRSPRFWGTGIDYILADRQMRHWMQQNAAAWRVILADADQVFANASVVIYKRRA
jgi:hypothetical protein